ncbi:MAG: GNAT family N-acyltransferase [Neisseria sp.]|nr:GNAT family N-acyltransferase [Neisseria sp.]
MPLSSKQSNPPEQFSIRLAENEQEIQAAQRLRYRVFAEEMGVDLHSSNGLDIDQYDAHCRHLLAFNNDSGEVIGCYRLLTESGAKAVGSWYSAGEFDLAPLQDILPQAVELGRACIHPDYRHGGLVMLLWGGLMKFMHDEKLRFMLGCGSISTADGGHEAAALYHSLKEKYLAPEQWRVRPLNPLALDSLTPAAEPECPALIKGYLNAGAWFCGKPCFDEAFRCADILILMDTTRLNPRYLQRFAAASE